MRRFKLTYCSLLLIICAVFLQSCARKTIQSVERSTDSVVIVKTDSVHDTIVVVSKMEKNDSVVDRMNTYVVVDTTGKVIYKYVYRDRNVTRNRDSANTQIKSSEIKQNKSEGKSSKNDSSKVVTKKGKSLAKSIALILFVVFLLWFYAIRKK